MSTDDQRYAANISVTLSGKLISAALAMLTIETAVLSFVYKDGITTGWFLLLILIGAVSFIFSIFIAGKGLTILRNKGYEGNWKPEPNKDHFNGQAILCLIGLICFFLAAVFIGQPKEVKSESQIQSLSIEIQSLKKEVELMKINNTNLLYKSCKSKEHKAK